MKLQSCATSSKAHFMFGPSNKAALHWQQKPLYEVQAEVHQTCLCSILFCSAAILSVSSHWLTPCKNTFFQPVMSLSVFTWGWSSSEKYGILLKCSEGTYGGKDYLFPKPQREFLRENHTAKRAVVILGVTQGEHWYIFLSLYFSEYLWSATQPSPNPHPVALFVISSEQTSHTLFTKIILCVKPEEHYS